ncbi:MAG: cytochrome C, partial [Gammaproteobacteria bacterium]|nr:cytochrome C [Gammaproteobacteria bacterium]
LECHACHKGSAYDEQLDTGCVSCHRADDVHRGQEGEQCEQCHNESGWGAKVFFDHDLTHFPLIGLHATAPCEECHMGGTFKDAQLDCVECHEADDVHEAKLGPACEQCHNPNGWALWQFDHNTQTDFVLDGAHEGLECLACHTVPVRRKIRQSRVCASCHMQDDVHRGQYGRVCDRCHTTEEFAPAILNR